MIPFFNDCICKRITYFFPVTEPFSFFLEPNCIIPLNMFHPTPGLDKWTTTTTTQHIHTHRHTSTLHSSIQLTHNPISQHISCLYSRLRPGYNTLALTSVWRSLNASPQKLIYLLVTCDVQCLILIWFWPDWLSVSKTVYLVHWLAPVQVHCATLARSDGLQRFQSPAGVCLAELHRLYIVPAAHTKRCDTVLQLGKAICHTNWINPHRNT